MEATLKKNAALPKVLWIVLLLVAIGMATYPIFFKPIKDTPATEDQSFPNAPTPPNEPGLPEEPVPRPDPTL